MLRPLVILSCLFFSHSLLAQSKSHPLREVAIIVAKEGYYPKNISVFKGEKVRFYVTSTYEVSDCVILDGHKLYLAAHQGKISESEVVFDKAGTFTFYCPSSKHNGEVLVIDKDKLNQNRKIASELNPNKWVPREY